MVVMTEPSAIGRFRGSLPGQVVAKRMIDNIQDGTTMYLLLNVTEIEFVNVVARKKLVRIADKDEFS